MKLGNKKCVLKINFNSPPNFKIVEMPKKVSFNAADFEPIKKYF